LAALYFALSRQLSVAQFVQFVCPESVHLNGRLAEWRSVASGGEWWRMESAKWALLLLAARQLAAELVVQLAPLGA